MTVPELFLWNEHPCTYQPEIPHRVYADIPCGPVPEYWWYVMHDKTVSFTEWIYTDPANAINHLLNFPLSPYTSNKLTIESVHHRKISNIAFGWKFYWGAIVGPEQIYRDWKSIGALKFEDTRFFRKGFTEEQQSEYDRTGWVNRK